MQLFDSLLVGDGCSQRERERELCWLCDSVETQWAAASVDAYTGEAVSSGAWVLAIPPGRWSDTAADTGESPLVITVFDLSVSTLKFLLLPTPSVLDGYF